MPDELNEIEGNVRELDIELLKRELDIKLLEQEHRIFRVVWNFISSRRFSREDPRRQACLHALLWRIFSPSTAAVTSLGVAGFVGLWLAYQANGLLDEQNQKIQEQTNLLVEQSQISARQNELLDVQNRSLGRELALTEFQQAAHIRKLIAESSTKRSLSNRGRFGGDTDHEVYEPNKAMARMISNLARSDRLKTASVLASLLGEWDGRTTGGALLTLRNVFHEASKEERKELEKLIPRLEPGHPKGHPYARPIKLNNVSLFYEDLSPLAGTGILRNALISNCNFEYVNFSGLDLSGVEFFNCDCSFSQLRNTKWKMTHASNVHFTWSSLEHAKFEQALMIGCDFRGMASNTGGSDEMVAAPLSKTDLSGVRFMHCTFINANIRMNEIMSNHFDKCAFFYAPHDIPPGILESSGAPNEFVLRTRDGGWMNLFGSESLLEHWLERRRKQGERNRLFEEIHQKTDSGSTTATDKSSEIE